MSERVIKHLQAQRDAILERLLTLIRFPSVSTDPAFAEGMRGAREFLLDRLRAAGLPDVRLLEAPGAGIIAFSVMIGVLVWMLYRVLRGAAVVYDVRPLKVYGYAIGGIALLLLVLVVSSGEAGATLSYLQEGIRGLYSGG